ncbi:MAG: DJ-1/PfpI family protein [Verrucomicrobia bacterium]|nr:DJ-1/PfpI family protein [Verrucomicrobiota bacterium]MCH8511586.1 DJ-1/PfpI family protein [Kiritimatiellia bacterium]
MKIFLTLICTFAIPLFAGAPRLLVLLEHGFNGDEFFGPTAAFRAAGYEVVVASTHSERVPLQLDQTPNPHWDVPVDLSISEVSPDDYIGLFVPGGYSPGFLEKDEDAVRVTRTFLEAGKPLGMVCHGPRVLLSHGLMGDRAWTGLHTLSDELADLWIERPGRYLDQAVVRDGNLVTARYPRDMNVFSQAFLELLAEHGGLSAVPREAQVALILSNHPERWGNWHFFSRLISATEAFGISVQRASGNSPEWIDRVLDELSAAERGPLILALDISSDEWEDTSPRLRELVLEHPHVVAGEGMRELLAAREGETVWMEERLIPDWTQALVSMAPEAKSNALAFDPAIPPQPELPELGAVESPTVFLALREGFDDEALVAWTRVLQATGHTDIAFVARETGEVTGRNGLTVRATLSHEEVKGGEGTLVVAPGFFWPRLNPGARQTEQPEWLHEQEARDLARIEWLLSTRENGSTLFLTGMDALRVGRMEAFHGTRFSSSEQTVWSFGRDGARYIEDPVTLSAERLITVRSAEDAADALELLTVDDEK